MNFNYLLKLQKSGKLKEAETGYRKLLKNDNQNPDIFTCLGLICIKTKRFIEWCYLQELISCNWDTIINLEF